MRPRALMPALLLTFTAAALAATNCEDLAKLALPATTITTAQQVAAGSFTPPEGAAVSDLPAFCRVAGVIQPSSDSHIQFEVWMPATGWNNKFQGIGNGGFAGTIGYAAMGAALRNGYATASTDTGHHAEPGAPNAAWALAHPEKVIDFGYRAIHETAVQAKSIIRAFYGAPAQHAYFSSCSNGGRQALMEAQRFPADYDGIIAGAPANYWTHLLSGTIWDMQAIADPASYISPKKLPAIEAATLAACDSLDGVKDGVIDDPSRCHFDPATLLCHGEETDSCLTAPQVTALSKIFSGPKTATGEQAFPGYSPGGITGPGGWTAWIVGASASSKSLQFSFGTQFFINMVYSDPAWDYRKFTVDHDMKVADDSEGRYLNATNADLKAFKARGGKLILYHGWSDAAIPPTNAINYYHSVISRMGARDTSAFVRLFMVPGMQHCGRGPGPNTFGQAMGPAPGDALHDIDAALERWVEQGTAPEQIIATRYNGLNRSSGVERTRPLCAYPKIAHWKGTGSTDDAANFECVSPAGAQTAPRKGVAAR